MFETSFYPHSEAAQARRDRRRVGIPHAGIADEREVGLQFIGIGSEERLQRWRAGFFFTLEQDGDLDRQRTLHRLIGTAGFNEGQKLTLACSSSGIWPGGLVLRLTWIDDKLCIAHANRVEHEKELLKGHFKCDDIGKVKDYIGCKLDIADDGRSLK